MHENRIDMTIKNIYLQKRNKTQLVEGREPLYYIEQYLEQ